MEVKVYGSRVVIECADHEQADRVAKQVREERVVMGGPKVGERVRWVTLRGRLDGGGR